MKFRNGDENRIHAFLRTLGYLIEVMMSRIKASRATPVGRSMLRISGDHTVKPSIGLDKAWDLRNDTTCIFMECRESVIQEGGVEYAPSSPREGHKFKNVEIYF